MKKIILSLTVIFIMSSFTNKTPEIEKTNVKKVTLVQLTPSDCVRYAKNIVLGYAAGNNMDTSRDSPEYEYLMSEYMSQYRNCLEDIGYLN